jgi:hypothetical protein
VLAGVVWLVAHVLHVFYVHEVVLVVDEHVEVVEQFVVNFVVLLAVR